MKKNLDYFVLLFICSLVFSGLYIMYEHSDKSSYSNSGSAITLRESGFNASVRGSSSHNSAFSSDMIGTTPRSISSNGSHLHVSAPVHSYDHFRGLSTPVASSRSLLSRDVTHGGTATNGGGGVVLRGSSANYSRSGSSRGSSSSGVSVLGSGNSSLQISSSFGANGAGAVSGLPFVPSKLKTSSFSSSLYADKTTSKPMIGEYLSSTYGSVSSAPRANAPQRAPGNLGGTWEIWFDRNWSGDFECGTENNGTWWFDEDEAGEAYDWMIKNWNKGLGDEPTEEDFYDWLRNNKDGKYRMPLGDIVPLILIALAYMVMMFVRKR